LLFIKVMKSINADKKSVKVLSNPITVVTALVLLVGFILAALALLFLGRDPVPAGEVTPVMTKIAAPTLTSKPPEPTPLPSSTPTSIFFLPEGVIGIGAYVQVTGTNGAGLRMRSEPNLESEINFTALDAEVFLVIDGPEEADGYTWWHLEAPYDQTRNGWSVGDYLTPIEEEGQ
jgi:hypothetical protein